MIFSFSQSLRKSLKIFERKVYRRILGPVYETEIESWRMLTYTEIYVMVKKHIVAGNIRLNSVGFDMYREWKRTEFTPPPKKI